MLPARPCIPAITSLLLLALNGLGWALPGSQERLRFVLLIAVLDSERWLNGESG